MYKPERRILPNLSNLRLSTITVRDIMPDSLVMAVPTCVQPIKLEQLCF